MHLMSIFFSRPRWIPVGDMQDPGIRDKEEVDMGGITDFQPCWPENIVTTEKKFKSQVDDLGWVVGSFKNLYLRG